MLLCHLRIIFLIVCFFQFAILKPHKDRQINKELSDRPHELDDSHSPEYDHEAFLGKEEARKFDDLKPDESKAKLAVLVDKMDLDKDGKVTEEELRSWIKLTSRRYLIEDRDRSWKDLYLNNEDKLTWDAYYKSVISNPDDEEDEESIGEIVEKDRKRWKVADLNGDGLLDKEEYLDFLHPEDSPRMRHVVIDETMVDLDTNRDGYIDLDEYIRDMWHGDADEVEPEWVKVERTTFKTKRDKNGDGKLDSAEVDEWILPKDFDHIESETKHLLTSADENEDGVLTKQEILDKYDLFVGSQATDFGEALSKDHDEL